MKWMCLNCRDRQQATQFVPQTTGGQRREFQKFGGEGCQTQRGCIQSRIQERIFWVQPCTGSFYTPTGYRGPTGGGDPTRWPSALVGTAYPNLTMGGADRRATRSWAELAREAANEERLWTAGFPGTGWLRSSRAIGEAQQNGNLIGQAVVKTTGFWGSPLQTMRSKPLSMDWFN
jgi:hypothetical protein